MKRLNNSSQLCETLAYVADHLSNLSGLVRSMQAALPAVRVEAGTRPKRHHPPAVQVITDAEKATRNGTEIDRETMRRQECFRDGFPRGKSPWSKKDFCADHHINEREYRRWLKGEMRSTSTTARNIRRELGAETARLRAAGFGTPSPR